MMRLKIVRTLCAAVVVISVAGSVAATRAHSERKAGPAPARARWTEQEAKDWYAKQPWLVGSDYLPASAINQLEMWQADTFDPKRIDTELGWAQGLGFTTMRVFLHDLLWQQDAEGFKRRINTFLEICAKHHIRPLFVFFDSCWDPNPHLGKQHAPVPGVHNSGWVQSPGAKALEDKSQYPRLEAYVKGVVGAFATDDRILGWDLWNEPDNDGGGNYHALEAKGKKELMLALLPHVYAWAREAGATQPLTSGVWNGNWGDDAKLSPTEKVQFGESDVVSFHSYEKPEVFEMRIQSLQHFHRPIICTEYMARKNGSTFQGSLPIAKKYHVGAINWGFASGKSNTIYPWDSWDHAYSQPPAVWFHDIFTSDGKPYSEDEVKLIRSLTHGS
jgi:hypothetical protein